jgi:hypothetical protein
VLVGSGHRHAHRHGHLLDLGLLLLGLGLEILRLGLHVVVVRIVRGGRRHERRHGICYSGCGRQRRLLIICVLKLMWLRMDVIMLNVLMGLLRLLLLRQMHGRLGVRVVRVGV